MPQFDEIVAAALAGGVRTPAQRKPFDDVMASISSKIGSVLSAPYRAGQALGGAERKRKTRVRDAIEAENARFSAARAERGAGEQRQRGLGGFPSPNVERYRGMREGLRDDGRGAIVPWKSGKPTRRSFDDLVSEVLKGPAAAGRALVDQGLAVPQLVRDTGGGFVDLMGGTRTGNITPEAVMTLADVAGGGAASAGVGGAVGRAGIFGGRLAKTADAGALARAEEMAARGVDRQQIWDETGFFQGREGKWRFEIDDSGAQFDTAGLQAKRAASLDAQGRITEDASIIRHRSERLGVSVEESSRLFEQEMRRRVSPETIELANSADGATLLKRAQDLEGTKPGDMPTVLGDVAQHPELFAAYPDMASRPYRQMGIEGGLGTHGGYAEAPDEFYSSKFYARGPAERSTGLHEVQHATQGREGFARGGSPEAEGSDEAYRRLAGEVEARNVQTRRDYSPERRQAEPPWTTEDVPADQQIVRMGDGGPSLASVLGGNPSALPMDEASRMARALEGGFDTDAVHGTTKGFDKFKRKQNDIGFHFGTAGQANDRLSYVTEVTGSRSAEGSRTMPVKLKLRKPLRMDDLGAWGSDNLLYALRENPAFRPEDVVRAYQSSRNESGRIAALRNLIESRGYDGIVYKNTGETAGGAELAAIQRQKYDEARKALGKKPRDNSFSVEEQKHPAYKAYSEAYDAATRHRETNAEDSYIAFRPSQVRSRFAAFDPAKRDSGDLLAAKVGTGLGPAGLLDAQSGDDDTQALVRALLRGKKDRRPLEVTIGRPKNWDVK